MVSAPAPSMPAMGYCPAASPPHSRPPSDTPRAGRESRHCPHSLTRHTRPRGSHERGECMHHRAPHPTAPDQATHDAPRTTAPEVHAEGNTTGTRPIVDQGGRRADPAAPRALHGFRACAQFLSASAARRYTPRSSDAPPASTPAPYGDCMWTTMGCARGLARRSKRCGTCPVRAQFVHYRL
jgi:hypothetical protein